jgi:hypothetical protein
MLPLLHEWALTPNERDVGDVLSAVLVDEVGRAV